MPLLTREEEVEISKRIEKAQWQVEKIILRFRYSASESISIASHIVSGKERFDKTISEKEVSNRQEIMRKLPKLTELLRKEDRCLEELFLSFNAPKGKKVDSTKILDEV